MRWTVPQPPQPTNLSLLTSPYQCNVIVYITLPREPKTCFIRNKVNISFERKYISWKTVKYSTQLYQLFS